MGVHSLWDLLAPVGRRVSVETLAGKKLAIDASIWMVQFMKAMRDEKGEMVRNAHLLGFFRRICKLMYLRTKPVFVFDGGTPALKRRTVIARRRQRENAQAKIRKTAEKLLLNHLKSMRLKDLAKDLEEQRKGNKEKKKVLLDGASAESARDLERDDDRVKLDEMVAASIAAEEGRGLNNFASTSGAGPASEEVDSDEEMMLPGTDENIDPDVLAALPPSMQLDLMMRKRLASDSRNNSQGAKQQGVASQNRIKKDKAKGKQVLSDQSNVEETDIEMQDDLAGRYNQEKLDEMLAASLMADQDGGFTKNASMFTSELPSEEGDGDDDEEMILPHGNVDPAVLASLPPSMQLDLLAQMRERLMAENRQRYQKVKKEPEKFSQLQIESYLKTVAFRREIDQVQRAAAGKGVGGVQTSRIASEANREFIFSKSFTGDKELLMSAGVKGRDKQQQKPTESSIDLVNSVASTDKSNITTGFVQDESTNSFDDGIETYLDESGRVRVSRLRAMGMRMTRDLQRNLDLIKEVEQYRTNSTMNSSTQSALEINTIVMPKSSPVENQLIKTKDSNITDSVNLSDENVSFLSNKEASMEISFEVGSSKCLDSDDDIFASLVAEKPVKVSPADYSLPTGQSSFSASDDDWEEGIIEQNDSSLVAEKPVKVSPADYSLPTGQSSFSASDDDWEEGIIEQNGNMPSYNAELTPKPSGRDSNAGDDSEVEWEEGACDVPGNSLHPAKAKEPVSRGYLAEEADLQEAIRRSLEDQGTVNFNVSSSKNEKLKGSVENAHKSSGFHDEENTGELRILGKDVSQQKKLFCGSYGIQNKDGTAQASIGQDFPSTGNHCKLSEGHDPDIEGMLVDETGQLKSSESHNHGALGVLIDEPCIQNPSFILGQSSQDTNEVGNLEGDLPSCEPVIPLVAKAVRSNVKQSSETSLNKLSTSTETSSGKGSHISEAVFGDVSPATLDNDGRNDTEGEPSPWINGESINTAAELSGNSAEKAKPPISFVGPAAKNPPNGSDTSLGQQKYYDDQFTKETSTMHQSEVTGDENAQFAFTEATLEEEMLILDQESMKLGDEQRKNERNAESVSSEMFTECQELLQMFGLPYIVAPMEAEAQCAYMELANLVDGVVTDDSDVFLFGARSVYKNIFDDRKYVETYFMKDIEKELGLTREQLVLIALLLGSDYTEGISGIGIVNAIEVVHAFPEEDGLHRFRKWVESPDPNILGKFSVQSGSSAKKKVSKVGANDVNCANNGVDEMVSSGQDVPRIGQEKPSVDQNQKVKQIFMDKHRNVSKNWHIPSSFPSEAVISAYSSPQVDKSTEPFTWGKPDLHVLQRLCWEKFGWGVQKSNELLMPVLKEYEKRETQLRLEAFYTFNERFAKIRSKRIKSALKGITGNKSMDLMDEDVEELSKGKRKKKGVGGPTGDKEHEQLVTRTEESGPGTKSSTLKKSNAKQSRKRQNAEDPLLPEEHQTNKASKGNGRGRGRTRGRGRGRGKVNVGFKLSDSSSGDVGDSDEEQEAYIEKSDSPRNIRRSSRSRKPVSYLMNELDLDDADKSTEQGDKKSTDEGTIDGVLFEAQGVSGGVNVEHDKMVDPSLNVDFSLDLERGSRFCNDGNDVGWADSSYNVDASEGDISGDYLKMGGGFCLDEDETGKEEDDAYTSPTAVQEIAESSTSPGHMDDAEAGNGLVHSISSIKKRSNEPEHGGTADIVGEDNNNDSLDVYGDLSKTNAAPESKEAPSVGGLSAMPFLKRKRRKT